MTKNQFVAGLLFSLLTCNLIIPLSGCSDRPRLNPLDPKNPNTQGMPTGLNVVSMRDTVTLHWNSIDLRNLSGFRIYRQLQGETSFFSIAETSASINSFHDIGVHFDIAHNYRISILAPYFESPLSDAVTITPGPTFSWVIDARNGDLVKLTHDGVHEILRSSVFFDPLRLQIDARRGHVWVIERFSALGRLNMNGRISGRFSRLESPTDLAVDNSDGSVWVADTLSNGLMKFDSTGMLLNSFEIYKKIVALAVHPATSDLWALSRDSLGVLIFSRDDEPRRPRIALTRPADIDVDSRTGKIWIADGSRVIKLNEHGLPDSLASTPFRLVKRLAADEASGGCWVIDYSTSLRDSRIVKLLPNGTPVFPPLTGFDLPGSLAVNPHDGSCLVADTGNRRLVRIAADGRILGFYNQISAPFDLDTAQ